MFNMKVLWNVISIVFFCAVCDASSLKTYYMDTAGNVITLQSTSSGKSSSGILKSHAKSSYDTYMNRTLTITAPSGIVASIRLLDLRPNCQDNLMLYEASYPSNVKSVCNRFAYRSREEDEYERRTLYASSGTLIVKFDHKPGGGSSFSYGGFQLTFTSVRDAPCKSYEFRCNNFRCISEKLRCDQHNHCGDTSDQLDCKLKISPGKIIGIICGVVFLVIAAVCGCYIIAKRRRNQTETTIIHQPAYPATYPQTAPYYAPPPPYTQGHNNPNYR